MICMNNLIVAAAITLAAVSSNVGAQVPASAIGVVVMHGKGGSPARNVAQLADALEEKGYLVANLNMPWSGARDYDVDVAAAEQEVQTVLDNMRSKGAKKVFVAGHSQGGVFAFYFGSRHDVDGVIAIAPGGDVGNNVFQEQLGASVSRARSLIAEGKGSERTQFQDYEGAKGISIVNTTPAVYMTWFDPKGAMHTFASLKALSPKIPVLYVAPTGDYPGLQRVKQSVIGALPSNPLTKVYEPNSNHLGAPSASRAEIVRWTQEVANAK
jgi:pimeloyl-ACP methyl ester carboxylesterase